MSFRQRTVIVVETFTVLAILSVGMLSSQRALAQLVQQAVGGISIDAQGVVGQPTVEDRRLLREHMLREVAPAPAGMSDATELRKVSLSRIEAALGDGGQLSELPDELRYLAGIQRVKYVFVYPEQNDIVLAGPGDGWRIDDSGSVVGVRSGRPMIPIDDLLVAFRSANAARETGIQCSIDPTREGMSSLQQFLARQRRIQPGEVAAVVDAIEETMGPQQVTVGGVPVDSHFARVLVASDYRMKRIGMNLEPSPVRGLPGFLDLVQSRPGGLKTMTPRWWLACNYEPMARDADGLAWELRGQGVKAMAEDDLFAADGTVQESRKAEPLVQEWADLMTAKYEELASADPVFGQLRNLMDLCVIAALIERHQLLAKADCQLPRIMDPDSDLSTDGWNAAKTVATQCSYVKKRRNYIITASGGIDIGSWEVVEKTQLDPEVGRTRDRAATSSTDTWWWN